MSGYPGKLIVIYGINNLGKSVQAKLLVEKLKENGYQAEYLKYPVYDIKPSGEILNSYLRLDNPDNLDAREAQIIFAFNRTQYQGELIAKLKSGINIVAEDYKGTGIAWGLGAGVDENFLKTINSHLLKEDLVFLFDGERFKEAMENGHRHENDEDLMTKVRWAHLKLQAEYGWLKINANRPIETIHEELWRATEKLLAGPELSEAIEHQITRPGFKSVNDIINYNHKIIYPTAEPKMPPLPAVKVMPVIKVAPETALEAAVSEAKTASEASYDLSTPEAGYDLSAADYYSLPPYGQALVRTGKKLAIPEGCIGLIWGKNSLSLQGVTIFGGVINPGDREEIKVVVKNLSEDMFNIIPGQKIAQLLIQPVRDEKPEEIN